mmetsp:Transcript_78852/g.229006  ORF Transcript_78852/g.229006 Transcript_78852/m.229006 type:complete len:302 (+) Transcript_78852:452-1357(+)
MSLRSLSVVMRLLWASTKHPASKTSKRHVVAAVAAPARATRARRSARDRNAMFSSAKASKRSACCERISPHNASAAPSSAASDVTTLVSEAAAATAEAAAPAPSRIPRPQVINVCLSARAQSRALTNEQPIPLAANVAASAAAVTPPAKTQAQGGRHDAIRIADIDSSQHNGPISDCCSWASPFPKVWPSGACTAHNCKPTGRNGNSETQPSKTGAWQKDLEAPTDGAKSPMQSMLSSGENIAHDSATAEGLAGPHSASAAGILSLAPPGRSEAPTAHEERHVAPVAVQRRLGRRGCRGEW